MLRCDHPRLKQNTQRENTKPKKNKFVDGPFTYSLVGFSSGFEDPLSFAKTQFSPSNSKALSNFSTPRFLQRRPLASSTGTILAGRRQHAPDIYFA